jgi:hypothetical protein
MRTNAEMLAQIAILGPYFKLKGSITPEAQYKVASDAPIKASLIKRTMGTWNWVTKRIGVLSQY